MVDDRPRPKYGELAPEGWSWQPPAPPQGADSGQGRTPSNGGADSQYGQPAPSAPSPAPPGSRDPSGETSAPAGAPRPIRAVDLSVTSLLLFFGLLFSASMIPALFDFNTVLIQAATAQGYTAFASSAAANTMGIVAGVVTIILQLVSIVISVRRLSQRKLAFPVPLVIGVVTFALWVGAITFAFFNDPSFVQQITAR
ncbi:DUF6264 family protein [Subtercola sp. PAMC28395]|uniref:DUF6264 family protein n=1 Tax=Subtercola sp. PAMC28395 TaxID=2846775 RepID=UPI00209B4B7C|nr:DUF6264 family protein [Subtercola sp. PAMC28395]